MAASIFTGISNLRMVLNTETDADSPDNETTYAALRIMVEVLFLLGFATGDSGSLTSDPPNDATGVATDTGAAYSVDEHNGRTLLFVSGNAIGNIYTVDDTTATTLVCTGDNLYSDGARSGDDYVVLYDIITNTDGHDHDTINAKGIVLGDDTVDSQHLAAGAIDEEHFASNVVDTTALKSSLGSVSEATGTLTNSTMPGGGYGFYPQVKMANTNSQAYEAHILYTGGAFAGWTSYVANISIKGAGGGDTLYAQQVYVTASGGTHWIFILKDKMTGDTMSVWEAPDHPCYGNRGIVQPFLSFDPNKHEILVVNPSEDDVEKILARCIPKEGGGFMTREDSKAGAKEDYLRPHRSFIEVAEEILMVDESNEADWPDYPITVALPKIYKGNIVSDWRFHPRFEFCEEEKKMVPVLVRSVKRVIEKPDYVTCLKYSIKQEA